MLIFAYLLGNLVYTYFVKHIPYLDMVSISIFAGMRVLAGFLLVGTPISWVLIGVVFTFYFFLTSVFRSVELELTGIATRPVLKHYNQKVLSFFTTFALMVTVTLYSLAMALLAFPLIYTDFIYFFILFYIYEFISDGSKNKKEAQDPITFVVHHRWLLSLCVLLILSIVTLVIWYY
jgi:4-hydroxybenzoate polyprenyltransferase